MARGTDLRTPDRDTGSVAVVVGDNRKKATSQTPNTLSLPTALMRWKVTNAGQPAPETAWSIGLVARRCAPGTARLESSLANSKRSFPSHSANALEGNQHKATSAGSQREAGSRTPR